MRKFYRNVLQSIEIGPDDTVLVVCGGQNDRDNLLSAGAENVTISNLDYHGGVSDYSPYRWERQDAENLDYKDGSFDWVVVYAGLHHCASPHRALCEMLRVSRKGIVAIESRDSLLMRAAVKLGLASEFEIEPAILSGGVSGGYRNGPIPNYVYRWTEREVVKTVNSFIPDNVVDCRFHYGYRSPVQRLSMSKSVLKRSAVFVLSSVRWIFERLLPRQGNQFAFTAVRTEQFRPWIRKNGTETTVDLDYISKIYDPKKYKRPPAISKSQ